MGGQSTATADFHCLPDKELSHICILVLAKFGNCLARLLDNCIFLHRAFSAMEFLFLYYFHPVTPISNSLKEVCFKGFA